jgi:predicted ATPase
VSYARALDSMPLALEPTAARARVLSPARIVARLPRRLDLLTGRRDADPRQQTLRATIAWSHELLTSPEQPLPPAGFLAGGCTIETAEPSPAQTSTLLKGSST